MRKQAFTLIEMLVVVAIIALLAAIISPAIIKGIDRAQTVRCASNLRQIGSALLSYASDHNGRYPPFSIDEDFANQALGEDTLYWSDKLLLGQYIGNESSYGLATKNSILVCPTADKPLDDNGTPYVSYGMNVRLYDTPPGSSWGVDLFLDSFPPAMIRHSHPAKTIFVIDCHAQRWNPGYGEYPPAYGITEPHSGNWNPGSPSSNFNWVRRHNNQTAANVVFLDGHVRLVRDLKAELDADQIKLN